MQHNQTPNYANRQGSFYNRLDYLGCFGYDICLWDMFYSSFFDVGLGSAPRHKTSRMTVLQNLDIYLAHK
jgi:hypothetical protein